MMLDFIDLSTLSIYLAAIFSMGLYFSKDNASTEAYFMGRRAFPHWAIGLSLVGTSISSVTFLAYPADAYKTGWLRFLPNLTLPIAAIITAACFLKFFRQQRTTTAYQFLEKRFGLSIRLYCASVFIFSQLVRLSLILYLLSLLVQQLTGLDPLFCIIGCGLFVGIYTVAGGIEAVVWTDVVQTLMLLIGGILCLGIIIVQLPGGLDQIFSVASAHAKISFSELVDGRLLPVSWQLSLVDKTASMMLILGLVHWLTEYTSNQNTVQRLCAAKSDNDARRGLFIASFSAIPIWAFYMFLGTALFVYYQQFPATEASQMLSGERKAEEILPFFILHNLPAGLKGLVLASAISAAMSSLDSSINAISTVGVVDIYRRCFQPNRCDRHYLKFAWLLASLSSLVMIVGALALAKVHTTTLQDTATTLAALLGGGLLSIYLLGFFTTEGKSSAIWVGIFCTLVFSTWVALGKIGTLPAAYRLPFEPYYSAIIGNIILFLTGFTVARLTSQLRKSPRQRLAT